MPKASRLAPKSIFGLPLALRFLFGPVLWSYTITDGSFRGFRWRAFTTGRGRPLTRHAEVRGPREERHAYFCEKPNAKTIYSAGFLPVKSSLRCFTTRPAVLVSSAGEEFLGRS